MINKRIFLYAAFLVTLMSINFLSYSAAVPFQPTEPKPPSQEEKYDLIRAVPRDFEKVFEFLQYEIARRLGAQQSKLDPNMYQIKPLQVNFTINHRAGVPMRPHISLKGIPINHRPDAENVFTPDLFNQLNIPRSIRLVGLLAIKSELPGHSDKLFIVADFADNPVGAFDNIAHQLDEISNIPRKYPYLHHITLAKIFPFKLGSQKISGSTVQKIQKTLDDVRKTIASFPDYHKDFPIDHIEYEYWQESTNPRTRQLWPAAIEGAGFERPAEPTYRRPTKTSAETIKAVAEAQRQPQRPPQMRETPPEVIRGVAEEQTRRQQQAALERLQRLEQEEAARPQEESLVHRNWQELIERLEQRKQEQEEIEARKALAHRERQMIHQLQPLRPAQEAVSVHGEWQAAIERLEPVRQPEERGWAQPMPAQAPAAPARAPIQPVPAPVIQPQPQAALAPRLAIPPAGQELPLHAAIRAGDKELVARLIAKGEDVNKGDSQGDSPLHVAADKGDLAIVQLLLENKADIFARDAKIRTPYIRALNAENYQISDLLGNWKVECPICMEEFRAVDLKAVGPCGHRICEKDLNAIYEREGEKAVCPLCRGAAYPKPVAH